MFIVFNFRNLSVFLPNLVNDDDVRRLSFESQIKQYKSNKVIVVDNSLDEWLYICMEVGGIRYSSNTTSKNQMNWP